MKKIVLVVCITFLIFVSCSKADAVDDIFVNNRKVLGTSSNDLLSDVKFKSMVIELVYVQGYEPDEQSILYFVSFLNQRIYKPGGIKVVKRLIASPGKAKYTNEDIIAFEDANRTKFNTDTEIAVWAFFTDGVSSLDTNTSVVLGTAYRNTSFIIFEKTIQAQSGGRFKPSKILVESTVLCHEFSHVLGLTNLGATPQSDHEDPDHKRHCKVASCLMYWEAESNSNMLSGGTVPLLDSQCLADLKANGGK